MFSDGYIGVASDIKKRLQNHKNKFKSIWNEIVVEILLIGDKNYCFDLENKLRSKKNIGWNLSRGGYKNNSMFGNENPNFNKKGIKSPNFIGWYLTPFGEFDRAEDAAKIYGCTTSAMQRKCRGRYVNGKFLKPQTGFAFKQKGGVKP